MTAEQNARGKVMAEEEAEEVRGCPGGSEVETRERREKACDDEACSIETFLR